MKWSKHLDKLSRILHLLSCRTMEGKEINVEEGFEEWGRKASSLGEKRGVIFFVGNGASASMASHAAADIAKNAGLHSEVFSDLSLLTAISNDMGYDRVFSEPLSRRAHSGDMLVAISSSGCSANVLSAVKVGNDIGMTVVTLSAMDEDNDLRGSGTLNMYVPAETYGDAESCHAAILHHWMDIVVREARE